MYDAPETATPETDAEGSHRVAKSELRQFVEQWERLEAEKKDIADQQKEVMAEAKARGYDNAAMKVVIKLRATDKDKLSEHEAVVDMYKDALGL